MPTRREGPAQGTAGAGEWSDCGCGVKDSGRSFPKFQPVSKGKNQLPQHQAARDLCTTAKPCCRPQMMPSGQAEVRHTCCSAHPNVSGSCSARPLEVPVRRQPATGNSRRVAYRPPLSSRCSHRPVPTVSLTRIYKLPEFSCDNDAEEGEGGEGEGFEESGADRTVTHSCLMRSVILEPRPCGCRLQSGPLGQLLQHSEVLLQDERQQPGNTNQSATKAAGNTLQKVTSKTQTAAAAAAAAATSALIVRNRSAPDQTDQTTSVTRLAQSAARLTKSPQKPTRRPVQAPRLVQLPCWLQQNQHHHQRKPAILSSLSSSPPTRSNPGRSATSTARPVNRISQSLRTVPPSGPSPERPRPPQHQHVLRRPLTGLLRYLNGDSSAMDY